mmetsp:Transcript_18404/g.28231  ORF Transcript_18404/g.28231 Transcript_18404/m.28231 type:complete len:100 (+) Transcript_18404:3515-3814(+)
MILTRWLSALNKKAERRDLLSPRQRALLETGTKAKDTQVMRVDMGEPTSKKNSSNNKYKRRARTFSRTKSSLMTFAKVPGEAPGANSAHGTLSFAGGEL